MLREVVGRGGKDPALEEFIVYLERRSYSSMIQNVSIRW